MHIQFLNHGVGGITDEMTIHKNVLKKKKKKKKKNVSTTLSVSAVVHFYSVSTVHIKDQKKPNEYDQEVPQSYTADQDKAWYYSAIYKTTESIPFQTQIVCAKMCVRFSTFCPKCCRTARERFCCLLCGKFHPTYGWCGIRCSFQCNTLSYSHRTWLFAVL